MNKNIELFCDGSVDPKTNIGFGAFFIYNKDTQNQNINIKMFKETSSTKLELEVLLWALKEQEDGQCVKVYTDCQNILTLLDRREKLEKNSFLTSSKKELKNSELYKDFYRQNDRLELSFIKIKGHKKSSLKDSIDNLFNLVDKASRQALREFNEKEEK
ncbi:ribonuclease HI [Halarcobacter ebronensis]|uniref:Ribonuclease H n=1 Tax=Halarcobacter ebronensis TaxID=1462615 RepID=A0A4Q1AZD2_9BACT|nr:RNase H family protein [Halarcobacter ebronensis]QKF82441.1 ribonuclease H family protein [Halarcobacter ebronensis]RXK07538.1 ribonuclease H [Halarcobacter ebronensis]